MDSRKDILMDENGDVYAKTGDFVIDASDDQHVQHILESAKGDYKQFPLIGANIMQLLNGKVGVEERRDIILAFTIL